jgi:2-amino-4-hydroxy-6-hydroxymethyldihydropteridine diphosphokinase
MMLISIGSNLPGTGGASPLETCRWAVTRLDALPDLRLAALSRWYSTAPVPPSSQPAYVNAVAVLRVAPGATEPDPTVLLAWLQAIEADAGRLRSVPNAARTLDLDIIAMGDGGLMVRAAPDPVLPHPRAHLRAFVLVPLLDVAPNWVHPVLRRPAAQLLAALPPQDVAVLD